MSNTRIAVFVVVKISQTKVMIIRQYKGCIFFPPSLTIMVVILMSNQKRNRRIEVAVTFRHISN